MTPRWSTSKCARTTPSTKPTTAPKSEADGRLLRREERRVRGGTSQQSRPSTCGSKSAPTMSWRCGIVVVVRRGTAASSRSRSQSHRYPSQSAPEPGENERRRRRHALEDRGGAAIARNLSHAARACTPIRGRTRLAAVPLEPKRTVAELRELRELTGDENGAQRVAWTETWERAREWLRGSSSRSTGAEESIDEAGNQWFTLARRVRARGAHRRPHRLGAERRLARRLPQRRRRRRGAAPRRRGGDAAGHGAARQLGRRGGRALRPQPLRLERGRRLDGRPGRAAPARRTATASRCRTRSPSTASTSTARSTRARELETAAAYLELHIEQGPVLESLDLPLGVVLGTFGVERHRITWRGQAAHAGSTPMDKRRDALAGAAKLALEIREIARRDGRRRRLHLRRRRLQAGIVTSVVETAEQLLDQRHLDARQARRDARRGEGGERALRGRGDDRGRVGADLVDRADPLRRDADRLLRRGDPRGRGHVAPAAVRPAPRRRRGRRAPACRR